MTSREHYAESQAQIQAERSGRTEHTVSVAPRTLSMGIDVTTYRAYCTCGMKSLRFASRENAESWASGHLEIAGKGPERVTEAPNAPALSSESPTAAPRADEGA